MALIVEQGFEQTTVEMVVERAEVDRATFDSEFEDLRDCCMKVYLANIEDFNEAVFGAADRESAWRDRLRAAAYTAARYIEARPIQTRFDMIQMLTVGDTAQAHRDRLLGRIVDLIDEGRGELDEPESMSREVAVGVFGSIYQFLLKELHGNPEYGEAGTEAPPLDSFVPQLMYIAVRPYLGHEAAAEEISLGPPVAAGEA